MLAFFVWLEVRLTFSCFTSKSFLAMSISSWTVKPDSSVALLKLLLASQGMLAPVRFAESLFTFVFSFLSCSQSLSDSHSLVRSSSISPMYLEIIVVMSLASSPSPLPPDPIQFPTSFSARSWAFFAVRTSIVSCMAFTRVRRFCVSLLSIWFS